MRRAFRALVGVTGVVLLAALICTPAGHAQQQQQQPQQQQPSDFEVTEDGKPQSVETFKFIKLDGGSLPSPDGPPRAIRTDADEESEAAKDDVRLFAIFLDDYHVRKENSLRVRAPLEQFVQTYIGPSDMMGLMYPLESVFNVRMTRNHEAVVKGVDKF